MTDNATSDRAERYDVFISYAHRDEREFGYAAELADALEAAGVSVWYDKELMDDAGVRWQSAIQRKMETATVMVALWSNTAVLRPMCQFEGIYAVGKDYLMPFETEPLSEPTPPDEDASDEAKIAYDHAQNFFGIIAPIQRVPFEVSAAVDQIKRRVAELNAAAEAQLAANEREQKRRELEEKLAPLPPSAAQLAQARIDLPAVLTSGSGFLAGRDVEESLLVDAWASCAPDAAPDAKTHIVVLHAIGGAGKTALLRRLVDRLAEHDFPHAEKVLGWSAYSQGSGENRNADSDAFIIEALRFMGETGALPKDGVARARLLAERIKATRTLLLLDGIEPLQSLPDVDKGRLKDKGLQRLIQDLALGHPGLVVITSRQHLPELETRKAPAVRNHPLDRLSAKAGAHLLRHLGCWGKAADMDAAVEETQGHALSVTLLGTYIDAVEAGDIAKRDRLELDRIVLTADELDASDETVRYAKRASAIIQGYIDRFRDLETKSRGKGAAERLLLSIVGLFDRPADGPAVNAILDGEPIKGLTSDYADWSPQMRRERMSAAKSRLRKLKLLAEADEADPDGLDAHPVVRAHFGKALQAASPEAFHAAHERLYRHYAAAAPNLPATLEAMTPLFHAIGHACCVKALVQEAFDDVYVRRVNRGGSTFYLTNQLGAYAANLGALAHFFDPPWSALKPGLTVPSARAAAFNYAAFALRALGRLAEAEEPEAASLAMSVEEEDWLGAALSASNISELRLTLGRVAAAVESGAEAVRHADRSRDAFWMMASRTTQADALAQAGRHRAAGALFVDAETRQALSEPDFPRLYSLPGYHYCDLVLDRGAAAEVRKRAAWMIEGEEQDGLLDRGLYRLADARVVALQAAWGDADAQQAAGPRLDAAIDALRAAGDDQRLPWGLLVRADIQGWAYTQDGDAAHLKIAGDDLAEVEDIAARGQMTLHLTDWRLVSARLALAHIQNAPPQALPPLVDGLPKPDEPWPDLVRPGAVTAEADAPQPPPSFFARWFRGAPQTAETPSTETPTWRTTPLSDAETRHLTDAETHTTEAAALIAETGYHRRDRDLADLRQRIDMLKALG